MPKKKQEKEVSRKDYLKSELLEHLKEIEPELNRRFDMFKVKNPGGTRGTFRNYLDNDFKEEDTYVFNDILQELKKDKVLFHISGRYWARLV